jgi:uncharacterized protein YxjI
MHPALNRNLYFVKEHAGLFKAANNYDVYDPETNQIVLNCREERLGILTKMLRFTDYKRYTPFEVMIRTPSGEPVLTVSRGVTFISSVVTALDEKGERIGGYRQKWFSLRSRFSVVGTNDQPLCMLQGNWTSWDFKFMAGDHELARVTKKWAGLGKELFTTADNYILSIAEDVPADNPIRGLIFGAVMCIDLVLKE